jgi:hypothetical protein
MTASLTLTGSVAALTAALAAFERVDGEPDAGSRTVAPLTPANSTLSQAISFAVAADAGNPSTDTGAGIPQQMPSLSVPSGAAPIPTAPMPSMSPVSTTIPAIQDGEDDEDEAGADTDGTGTDAEGLPWDARIHSSSKKKTDKGLWAARRGGPKGAELAVIKDELRGVTQVPMPLPVALTPVPMPPPVIEQPVAAPLPMPAVMPPPVPMPVAPEPVAAPLPMPTPEPVAAPAAAEEWDFAKLMAQIGPKMGTVIDPQYLAQVCQHYGIGAITDTATKPELIGQIVAQFQADGRW